MAYQENEDLVRSCKTSGTVEQYALGYENLFLPFVIMAMLTIIR